MHQKSVCGYGPIIAPSRPILTPILQKSLCGYGLIRPIPTTPIWSRPTAIVRRLESANWIGVKILNMLDTGSRPTITKSAVESADSELESADSTTDSPKVGVWVRALSMGLL